MGKIHLNIKGILKRVAWFIIGVLLTQMVTSLSTSLWLLLNDKWEWSMVYMRVLQDAYQSGYVRGTPFRTPEGSWAVNWQLGGPPFINVLMPYVFVLSFLSGVLPLSAYLVKNYRGFTRLKRSCMYLRHPRTFRKYISLRCVSVMVLVSLCSLALIAVTTFYPRAILPGEPSKNYLGVTLTTSLSLEVTVTRKAVIEVDQFRMTGDNVDGYFQVVIRTPENSLWGITDIDSSTILLNETLTPSSALISTGGNGTEFMVATFDKTSLLSMLENKPKLGPETVTLKVTGRLRNGDLFAGDTQARTAFT